MRLLSRILVSALALVLVAYIIPGIEISGLYAAIIAAIVLGLLNSVVKPLLVILTLPITILTLGLFIFVINAGLFLFAASFIDGFTVDSFITALVGSVIVSVLSAVGNKYIS